VSSVLLAIVLLALLAAASVGMGMRSLKRARNLSGELDAEFTRLEHEHPELGSADERESEAYAEEHEDELRSRYPRVAALYGLVDAHRIRDALRLLRRRR
jgi:hypothetical protein